MSAGVSTRLAARFRAVWEEVDGAARAAIVWDGADWRGYGLEAAIIVPRPRYAMARLTLQQALRGALAGQEFSVVYQPQVRSRDGRIGGVEALVRWAHPNGGILQPASFLPVAESSGLVVGLDRWVARVAAYVLLMRDEYPPFRLDR